MANVTVKGVINASSAKVWDTISDFNGLGQYVSNVKSSSVDGTGPGCKRTLVLQNDARLVEELKSMDHEVMVLEYSIVSSPLPVSNYVSKMEIRVVAEDQCEISWSSSFEPEGVEEDVAINIIRDIYSSGIDGLIKFFQ